MIVIEMNNEQKAQVHLTPLTDKEKPAQIDGKINYEVTEGDVTVDETDNANPFFVSGDAAAESKVIASFDADLGEGVETHTQEFSVVVSQARASKFGVVVDSPISK